MKSLVWLALVAFTGLCIWAVTQQGYLALWIVPFQQPVTIAIGVDLLIMLGLGCVWMYVDARRTQRILWPYLFLTLSCGSIGLLLYLALCDWPATGSVGKNGAYQHKLVRGTLGCTAVSLLFSFERYLVGLDSTFAIVTGIFPLGRH